ncbi:HEPN domain-containing protein [Candidatus Woesearchaeota archaeon]|nr:HEPN domain-containing protein [Candidatus Woesearchaeota archaeon]
MKEFEFFLKKGDVKKQAPDNNLSVATIKESFDRLNLTKSLLNKAKPKYVLENAYESMREAADSILYKEGFKSFSHEASIIYLLRKGFTNDEINAFDRFRKIRNGIKYYGKDCDKEDAEEAFSLAKKVVSRIREMLE